jgi:uncharacterized protein YidB (DUF937 family)
MSVSNEANKIVENTKGDPGHQSLVIETVGFLASHQGGLNSLIQAFEQNGLGHIISSWISNQQNSPVSGDQIKAVLGSQHIADLARNTGVAPDKVVEHLRNSLPSLVDALTPNGRVGSPSDLQSRGRELLAAFVPLQPAS